MKAVIEVAARGTILDTVAAQIAAMGAGRPLGAPGPVGPAAAARPLPHGGPARRAATARPLDTLTADLKALAGPRLLEQGG